MSDGRRANVVRRWTTVNGWPASDGGEANVGRQSRTRATAVYEGQVDSRWFIHGRSCQQREHHIFKYEGPRDSMSSSCSSMAEWSTQHAVRWGRISVDQCGTEGSTGVRGREILKGTMG